MKRNVIKQDFLVMKLLLNELTEAGKPQSRGSQGPSLTEDLWVKKGEIAVVVDYGKRARVRKDERGKHREKSCKML